MRKQPETFQGIVRKYRRREPAIFAKMRTLVGQYLHEHEAQASSLINDFEVGADVTGRFVELTRGDSMEEELLAELPSMTPESFREVIETTSSGLFTKDEFIDTVFHLTKATAPYEKYKECEELVTRFFSDERELFLRLLKASHLEESDAGDEVYDQFVRRCVQEGIYSLQCLTFGDWKYHLTYFTDTQDRLQRAVKGISTRMVHVSDDVVSLKEQGIDLHLKAPNGEYKDRILAGHDPARVLQLPQAHSCPSCHRPFASATALAVHRRRCA
jgi:hypothetical protein